MVEGITRSKDGVPQWAGEASLFQAYEEEALQWEQSVAHHKRDLCGPKLIAQLSGTARKFVVGKKPNWVSFNGGVQRLLDHLRQSLGRPKIPELSELLNRFFRSSRRRRMETMNDYIVRKVELYARTRQAMARVLPHYGDNSSRWRSASTWHWRNRQPWSDPSWNNWSATHTEEPAASESGVGGTEPAEEEFGTPRNESWDPWSSAHSQSWQSWYNRQGYTHDDEENEDWANHAPELLPEFLQGWYLLHDSGLDSHERNLIQTAIGDNYDVHRVAQELRTQWPDEELRKRDQAVKPSAYWQDDDDEDPAEEAGQPWSAEALQSEGMTPEGIYLMTEEEEKAEEALALIQQAKRTLKEARAKQHQVKLSRQYYKVDATTRKSSSNKATGISCFKCGGPHRIAECPDRHAPKDGPKAAAADHEAPFICYSEAFLGEGNSDMPAPSRTGMTTAEAVKAGYGVIDGGATKTLGSTHALEAVMNLNVEKYQDGRVLQVNTSEKPSFGFGNSSRDTCCSTTTLKIMANDRPGELTVHALDKGEGPILLSISMLRKLGAIIDFENDLVAFRHINQNKVIQAKRSASGHQLLPLSEDLYSQAMDTKHPVPSLLDLCRI